jgi:signal transduction histidine kinase
MASDSHRPLSRILSLLVIAVGTVLTLVVAVAVREMLAAAAQYREAGALAVARQRAVDQLLVDLLNAETGSRGYLLTGRGDYLQPFTQAKTRYGNDLDRLVALSRDEPELLAGIRSVDATAQRWFADAIDGLRYRRLGRDRDAIAHVNRGVGARLIRAFRTAHQELSAHIDQARERAVARADHRRLTALGVVAGAALVALLVVAGAARGLWRWVGVPLRGLAAAARRLALDPAHAPAAQPAGRVAELHDLTEAFNHMQEDLRAYIEELRASRARIVRAGDEARRRLERDLHDGVQQRLVLLAMKLRLARGRLDDDPLAARALLGEAQEDAGRAVEELREMARGLHPPLLTERGLGPALEALVARAPLRVTLIEAPPDRLNASVEAAAYFTVAESLTNVAKHAQAMHASVRVVHEGAQLIVEVRDDGVGGADPRRGSGLRGLADRLAALDGLLEVVSPRGAGTVVRAVIPASGEARPA